MDGGFKRYLKGEIIDRDHKISGSGARKGTKLTEKILDDIEPEDYCKLKLKENAERDTKIKDIEKKVKRQIDALKSSLKIKSTALKKGR